MSTAETAAPYYEPLSGRDAWFLYAEKPELPLDIGTVYIFEGGSRIPGGRGALGIAQTIQARLDRVPRYRMRIQRVPFNLAHPVWVDDQHFDINNHVHHEVLPQPVDGVSFRAAVARIMHRPMDKRHPLWEMTVLEGLPGGRVAVLNRAHHAMVDGVSSADIATLLFDLDPEGSDPAPTAEPWKPRPAPTPWQLLRPVLLNLSRDTEGPARRIGRASSGAVRQPWRGLLSFGRNALAPKPRFFFNRKVGVTRTGRGLKIPLSNLKALKAQHGVTVNDAVLGVIGEGLHRWLLERGGRTPDQIRVFCPVSVRDESQRNQMGNRISGMVVELPIGDIALSERLRLIKARTEYLKLTKQAIAADHLAALADWAPSSLLVLAGRLMSSQQGGANLNVTNVPGPQFPLYTGGAQLLEVWPFAPLYPNMGVGIAIVSYNGDLYFGFTADPEIVPDIEDFVGHIRDASTAASAIAAA